MTLNARSAERMFAWERCGNLAVQPMSVIGSRDAFDPGLTVGARRSLAPMTLWPAPLVPGFHPDPSVVLADGVYTLVTSTFEYLPGLPVHRSTDLVTWELVGHVISRPEQALL